MEEEEEDDVDSDESRVSQGVSSGFTPSLNAT